MIRKKITYCLILISLTLISCSSSNNSTSSGNPPSSWALPELTQEQKQQLVSSVKMVFNNFYVHQEVKLNQYNYSAITHANELDANMPSAQLLVATRDIFRNLHDLHTQFAYPVPASCVIVGFPLKSKLAYDNQGQPHLIIQQKLAANLGNTNSLYNSNYAALNIGDEILTIQNLGTEGDDNSRTYTVNEAINILGQYAMGANDDAFISRAIDSLFSRNGSNVQPPSGDFTITVKSANNGLVAAYKFPWISYPSNADACATFTANMDKKTYNILPKNNKHFVPDETVASILGAYSDANISTTVLLHNNRPYGYIKINSFVPDDVDPFANYLLVRTAIYNEVNIIKQFLTTEQNIDGIIIDITDNGGGFANFPQLIANLLTNQLVPNMVISPRVSALNSQAFANLAASRYYSRLGTSDPLDSIDLSTSNQMNVYLDSKSPDIVPQITEGKLLLTPQDRYDSYENDHLPSDYSKSANPPVFTKKPVALLVNSDCFSACDIAAAFFKDYKIAKIFGETLHTGGGGASDTSWEEFAAPIVIDQNGNKSTIIPNIQPLPLGMTLTFAWSQIFRPLADSAESLIEGNGVLANEVLKPTIRDVLDNNSQILNKIMDEMDTNPQSFPLNR